MSNTTITFTEEELSMLRAAMAAYRLKGFPLGVSHYGNPITHDMRRDWAAFGMGVWDKLVKEREQ